MTVVHRVVRFGISDPRSYRPRASIMKKPSKTAAELEASIKVEMEDICDWPTDMASPFSRMATVGRWPLCKQD